MADNDSSRSKCLVVTYGVNDRIHTVIFLVQTVDGPLDWIIIECICCLNYLIVICPVWWPEEKHLISCKFLHFVMPALYQFFHTIRIVRNPSARHKKCHLYLMFIKCIHNVRKILRSPGSIKAERHFLFRCVHTIDRQLPVSHFCACNHGLCRLIRNYH